MANTQDINAEPPGRLANVPPDISSGAAHTRIVVQEIKDDIRDIKKDQKTDFRSIGGMVIAGFLILGSMLMFGFFRIDDRITKLDDKVNGLSTTLTRIDTKLEDLLARIPPTSTPVPQRRP
jgi:archaellum component FlaC